MKKTDWKVIVALQALLILFSFANVLSKAASRHPLLSVPFCLCYGGMIAVLGLYAIGWQQVIKRIPLTTAYANRAVCTFWTLLWSVLFFGEQITLGKVLGAAVVVTGVVLYTSAGAADVQS